MKLPKKDSLVEKIIKENKIDFVISLNYTKTPEIYNFNRKTFNINSIKSEWTSFESMKGKYINLHAFDLSERDIHFVLGHDESSKIAKNRFILEWPEKNRFNPKELFLENLLHTSMIKKIITYGYSFGKSDKNINEFFETASEKTDVIVYLKDCEKIENMELNDFLSMCF